ncbi:unnamed protein product [Clonostachys rosea]|uniref:ZZ-type domain-containing protein n=1 Tax=Bionectria ochroleuca TaxID=29856 RepID=A0ABY6V1U0_BIOOC|nr:unnamed protein product [Clonostachys rosea]
MELNPREEKNQSSDPAPMAETNQADSQAMSGNGSRSQDAVEVASVCAGQPMTDAAIANLAGSEEKPQENQHSGFMWSGSTPHSGWEPSYVAMVKCDLCNLPGRGVVHQCNQCKMTVCGGCYGEGKLDRDQVHSIAPGSLNWEVPETSNAAATSPSGSRGRGSRGRGSRGRGGYRRGGLFAGVPYENPAFSIHAQAGASGVPPWRQRAVGPWSTSQQAHEGGGNYNGAGAPSFHQIEQSPGANFQFHPAPLLGSSLRPEVGVHAASTASQNYNATGNAPNFSFGYAESPSAAPVASQSHIVTSNAPNSSFGSVESTHARGGNNRRRYQPRGRQARGGPRMGVGVDEHTAMPFGNQHDYGPLYNSQTAPRAINDLAKYSLANQNNHSFADFHQPIEASSSNPGVQLPRIKALNRPRQPWSLRPSVWGSELVSRTLELNRVLEDWPLEEERDLRRKTSEAEAFNFLLKAHYHAAKTLNLNLTSNAAAEWLLSLRQQLNDEGI